MWPYENCDIPFTERYFRGWISEFDECEKKMKLWFRFVYLSLTAIVVFALLTFIFWTPTGAYWLPVIFGGCTLLSTELMIFSLCRWRSWANLLNLCCRFLRPAPGEMVEGFHAQNVPMNPEG